MAREMARERQREKERDRQTERRRDRETERERFSEKEKIQNDSDTQYDCDAGGLGVLWVNGLP